MERNVKIMNSFRSVSLCISFFLSFFKNQNVNIISVAVMYDVPIHHFVNLFGFVIYRNYVLLKKKFCKLTFNLTKKHICIFVVISNKIQLKCIRLHFWKRTLIYKI